MTFDPAAFTRQLAELGLNLSATRLADNSIRLNRWCMLDYWDNEPAAVDLWTRTIEQNPDNQRRLAEFVLMQPAPV
jgi:hypothetical protein